MSRLQTKPHKQAHIDCVSSGETPHPHSRLRVVLDYYKLKLKQKLYTPFLWLEPLSKWFDSVWSHDSLCQIVTATTLSNLVGVLSTSKQTNTLYLS
jgi:hypothetical protein